VSILRKMEKLFVNIITYSLSWLASSSLEFLDFWALQALSNMGYLISTPASSTDANLAVMSQAGDLTQSCFEAAIYAGYFLLTIPVTDFTTLSREVL